MHSWFECKVKFEKTIEEGKIITVSESYLVDSLTFTDAEERIVEEMKPFISGEFSVTNIKRVKISEMFFSENAEYWFRSKVNFVTFDENRGVEKKTPVNMMVQASNISEALQRLTEGMKSSMADYQIALITETPIVDVFLFGKKSE